MDKWDIGVVITFMIVAAFASYGITKDYYERQLSAKTNEYERAVRSAAYNRTHLILDKGEFFEVKIYRMDTDGREIYIIRQRK